MYLGPDVLKEVIDTAELYPIQGLFNFSNYFNEIDAYYHHSLGFELGVSTGWRGLDGLYNVSTILYLCLDCNFILFLIFLWLCLTPEDYIKFKCTSKY